ncbi:hypothetical protein GCM10020366_03600 [Saccharopolyspora gregorii]|uniref:Uncharacterized protein n=1 Tax=Saccharopolyspora gregorii TaxID=33914 RepID=A0ABP6RGL2_9PSEU
MQKLWGPSDVADYLGVPSAPSTNGAPEAPDPQENASANTSGTDPKTSKPGTTHSPRG